MLTLTDNASMIVKTIADQPESPATGLRITGDQAQEAAFEISTATGPEPEDQVVEQDGAQLFLDTAAAEQLDDKVLDAAVDESGNVQFALAVQG